MAKIKVHAGDFEKQPGRYNFGMLTLYTQEHPFAGESIHENELESVEPASEQSVKRVGGTAGWGLAGGALLGPAGLLGGLLIGGRGKDVTFVARFKDGRKLLATTDNKTFIKLQAAVF